MYFLIQIPAAGLSDIQHVQKLPSYNLTIVHTENWKRYDHKVFLHSVPQPVYPVPLLQLSEPPKADVPIAP